MKGTGCLEDIFTHTNSIEHKRVFNPYGGNTQVNACHNEKLGGQDCSPAV